ncbi:hypothetical protein N431DRAFT_502903 [Stipitochalara longipes BDJ]|nr:hypothetical protein N431DRAFT_502903 [Stipitochalara longipes BDJ]
MECAICKKPATMACSDCKDSPALQGDRPIVYYCNSACQEANLPQHKTTCSRLQDRIALYRVSDLAQKLFFIHRELTWGQFDVQRVEESDISWPKDYRVFPSNLFKTEEDRTAALTLMGCIDAWQWMNEFVAGMLKEVVTNCEHIIFKTKNDKRRTRCYEPSVPQTDIDSDTGGITHEVLKLTLRSGEVFAVDLACAQYGYSEPVIGWEGYKALRILFGKSMGGRAISKIYGMLQVDDYSIEKMIFFVNKMGENRPSLSSAMSILEAMNFSMLEWQMDEELSIEALLRMPEKQFQRKKDDLVNYLDWKLDNPQKKYFTVNGRRLKKERPRKWIHGK